MHFLIETLLVLSLLFKDCTYSLRLLEVHIPKYVIKGSVAQLECLYDLDGEALYSVKWYKDGNEFYRYVPRDMPPAQTFLLPGVSVDLQNSSDAIVTLNNVNLQTAGRFRCEVSGEAPSFQTVTEHADMIVVSLPDQGPPKITGGRPRYQIGDWVNVNCTAGRSKPAVQLTWFINGEPVESFLTKKYGTILSGRDGLETSVLGLQFRVEQHHFRHGDMKLKCVAALSTFYWRSNEESVEGDRPQKAPVLESRETVYASNSRADPVQANNSDSIVMRRQSSNLLYILLLTAFIIIGNRCIYEFLQMQQLKCHKQIETSENKDDEKESGKTRKLSRNEDENENEKEKENQNEYLPSRSTNSSLSFSLSLLSSASLSSSPSPSPSSPSLLSAFSTSTMPSTSFIDLTSISLKAFPSPIIKLFPETLSLSMQKSEDAAR